MHVADLARTLYAEVQIRPVPLLALRLPQFERIAWREGKRAAQRLERSAARAFLQGARQSLRSQDMLAHDPDSDVFIAATLVPPRRSGTTDCSMPTAMDCRSALGRIAAGMSVATGLTVETGWTLVRKMERERDMETEIAVALERGLRERERYEFFATVGHELRTPLTSIRGYLETLLDGEIDPSTARRFLQTARRETLRLGRLVDTMFEFSLLDLSASALAASGCDLLEAVDAACEVVRPLAAARGIRISRDAQTAGIAGLDKDACLQALINLLENAVKYGKQDGHVRIGVAVDSPFVRIAVEDDGPGIAACDREKIFGLRVRGPQSGRPGTGIGLAIVRMIAERAGGAIAVRESALGGAHFELVLPIRAELAAPVS